MSLLFLDTETYCETPIKDGLHRYAEDVEITLFAYAFDDGPVSVIDMTIDGLPKAVREALTDPAVTKVIHNSAFDRTVMSHDLLIDIPLEQTHDTMVRALAHGLPGSLGKLCEVMGVPTDQAKDKAGKALIRLFCQPRPKNAKIRRATRHSHPDDWQRFIDYAALDIEAMRVLYRKLPTWNYSGRELDLWRLDQRINERGVAVDTQLAEAAVRAVQQAQLGLGHRCSELTGGEVERASQRDQLIKHLLSEHGVSLPDMQAATLERRLQDPDLPASVRDLLAIRLQATTTSTSKYQALMRGVSSDGRLRGTLQFCGASRTGRWAGRLFQPQNLPRPNLKQSVIDQGVEALKADCADLITENVMELVSNTIRGCIVAPPGRKLVVADLSNIEGRGAAALAGESWKLQAFRDYDAGTGHDLYVLAYARAFGMDPALVTKTQRQIGKVMELMLQYEGGVGAYLTGAATYGFDVEQMAADAMPLLPPMAREKAEEMLAWRKRKSLTTYGLSDCAFTVCEAFKALWREAHPAISSYWKEIENAALEAICIPGVVVPARSLAFVRQGAWLRMILPSGRSLCYPSARQEDGKITYMGVNQYTRQWDRLHTYGGKLFENACQGWARDVMAANMPAVEAEGFDIVLTVHDELITEAGPDATVEDLCRLLSTPPDWADGVPLAAGGFEALRYRKD
jgi:DNA polymerase